MDKRVTDFLAEVCKPIMSKELREAVRSELATHLLEKTEELVVEGFSEEEAVSLAVETMGAAQEIGERIAEAYKPDYKACFGGVALFSAAIMFTVGLTAMPSSWFVDFPSLVIVLVGGAALVLIGGYKSVSAEDLLRRFAKTVIYAGFAGCLICGIAILTMLSNISDLGPNAAVMLLSLFYSVIFSALAHALIPLTPTARLRKTPVSETLSLE